MRARAAAWTLLVLAAVASGCPSSSSAPRIAITAGSTQATGPVLLTATVLNTSAEPSWSLTGPGSLSGASGHSVVYLPPVPPGAAVGQTATVTASVGGASASVQIQIATPALADVAIPGLGNPVQVLYDARDVPHIQCAAAADCFRVQGYLQARDRLFSMDFYRRVARGKLAELVGPLGLGQDVQLRTLFTTRDGRRLEDALVAALDAPTTALLGAYVDGVNAYLAHLRAAPAELPGEYAQLPIPITPATLTAADIPNWSVEDVEALGRLQQFQLSETLFEESDYGVFAQAYGPGAPLADLGKMNTWIRAAPAASPPTFTVIQNAPVQAAASTPTAPALSGWGPSLAAVHARVGSLREALKPLSATFGSNNWVVDAAHSANGHAMVANDPHLDLPYPPNFHLAALTSSNPADNLDVNGGSFPGIPGALVGRGKNVGWGVTVVGYDVTDLYLEQALPACPPGVPANTAFCVLWKGAPAPVLAYPQAFMVRTATGLQNAVALGLLTAQASLVAVVPHHGPLIQAPDPATGKAVSVRWTGHEGWTQDLKAFLGLATAPGVDAAMVALNDYATGAQNFVLADDQGNIAYYPHALVPIRTFADVRVTSPANLIPPWFPLPGDGSAEWGNDPACNGAAAPRTCFLTDGELPQSKNPLWGYLATSNADPAGVSADNNPLAHPPYLSFDWDDSTGFRHARIVARLKDLTTTGTGTVSLADMESIQSDHVSTIGKAFTDILATAAFDPAAAASPDFAAARAMLQAWGASARPYDCPTGLLGSDPDLSPADPDPVNQANSAACFLFHVFLRTLLRDVFADDLAVAGLSVGPVQAVKGMLHMLDPTTPAGEQGFCDDVDPGGGVVKSRTCGDQVVAALVTAFDTLAASKGPARNWLWGRSHTFTVASLFPTVTVGYQAGPFARPGGAFSVDVGNPGLSGTGTSFPFTSSGNVRHISVMDPATPAVRMQLPGPERDGPFGVVLGPDLLGEWVGNTYFDYATTGQIAAVAVATQTFRSP